MRGQRALRSGTYLDDRRAQALTGLEFNEEAVKSNTKPDVGGAVIELDEGALATRPLFPAAQDDLYPVAIQHGPFINRENPDEEHIDERVHWTMIAKRERRTTPTYQPA